MKSILLILFSVLFISPAFSQNEEQNKFPFVSGYIGAAVPITSYTKDGFSSNFNSSSTLVFPIGFNLNKSEKFSYSIELDPVITFRGDSSSVANLAILPGVLLHQQKVTYGIRAAFETNGRYGMSFSLLKSVFKSEDFNIVLGWPIDIRTGNNSPNSIGTALLVVVVI